MGSNRLTDLNDLPVEEWRALIALAEEIEAYPRDYADRCKSRIMVTMFYEPSTRTQFSFQAAMMRLGGGVIGFDDPATTSVSKGESLGDTIRIVSGYSDIIVMRHPVEGAPLAASLYTDKPVINAGDGGHLHPTQTLADLYTVHKELGRFGGLKIGVCGDLQYGRTVHSLLRALALLGGNEYYLISTPTLRPPDYVVSALCAGGESKNKVYYPESLEECVGELDILYMTRIQKERFASAEDYEKQRGVYVLDSKKLAKAKPGLKVLHPLPRVDEISPEVDADPRALYFKQAENGVLMRMALIIRMLEYIHPASAPCGDSGRLWGVAPDGRKCTNPRCVTNFETHIPAYVKHHADGISCAYCDGSVG